MKSFVHASVAAALVATAIAAETPAAFAGPKGTYYEGVSRAPLFLDRAPRPLERRAPGVRNRGDALDLSPTGSVNRTMRIIPGGEGEYYPGISRQPW